MFEKIKTPIWDKQKFCYKSNDDFYFRYSKGLNNITLTRAVNTIQAKLFLDDGAIPGILSSLMIYKEPRNFHIVLVSFTDRVTDVRSFHAVGIVRNGEIHIYVRPKYRRLGIGTRIIEFLRFKKVKITGFQVGIKGSLKFYQRNAIA